MLVFGHVGIAAALVHAVRPDADLRKVALAAVLPDLVDKPIAFLVPWFAHGWTRNVSHGLTGLVVFTTLAALRLGRRDLGPRLLPLVVAYALHLVLDRMWEDGHILLWPWDGPWFSPHPLTITERWWRKLFDGWTLSGEAIGFAACALLAVRGRLFERDARRRFLSTGLLGRPDAVAPA